MMNFTVKTFVIIAICVLPQCKDTESTIQPQKNTHRIKNITLLNNGIELCRCEFTYTNEQLAQSIWSTAFNNHTINQELREYDYKNNTIHEFVSNWRNNKWEETTVNMYIMQGRKLLELHTMNCYADSWNLINKLLYTYDNDLLTDSKYIELEDGRETEICKQQIIYHQDKVKEIRTFEKDDSDNWIWYHKEVFDYSRENITEIDIYVMTPALDWEMKERVQIFSPNQRTTEIQVFRKMEGSIFWHLVNSTIFLYNTNNCLYKVIEHDGHETEYTYEEGHGNASLFYRTPMHCTIGYPGLKSASKHPFDTHQNIAYYWKSFALR